MCFKKGVILFIIVFSTVLTIFSNSPLASCSVTSEIEAAEIDVRDTFKVILEAEKAGADITHLLSRLQDAGTLLEEAESHYQTGDVNQSTISTLIVRVHEEVFAIADEAANLERSSIVESLNVFWLTLGFSTVGGLVFVLVLILIWFWFKARYMKRLLQAKPEVVDVET